MSTTSRRSVAAVTTSLIPRIGHGRLGSRPFTCAILPKCHRRLKKRPVLPPRAFAPLACMRAALNLHTARSSISAHSPTPIRASRNIPGFPFSLATVLRKDRSGRSNGAPVFPHTVRHFMGSRAANRPSAEAFMACWSEISICAVLPLLACPARLR